jgi:hypothetical protein
MATIKERLLSAINTVIYLESYNDEDYVFSGRYNISPMAMVYILQKLAIDFQFSITDEFVDSLDKCTFARLEELLAQYGNVCVGNT